MTTDRQDENNLQNDELETGGWLSAYSVYLLTAASLCLLEVIGSRPQGFHTWPVIIFVMTLVKFGIYAFAVNSLKRVGTAWVARLHVVLNAVVAVTIVLAQVGYLGTLPPLILVQWSPAFFNSLGFGLYLPELIEMLPPLIFAVCWAVYWAVSKRVKAKYPLNGTSELAPIWVRRRDLTPDIDRDWTRVWVLTMLLASLLTLIPWLSNAPMYTAMSFANNRGFQAAPLLYFLYPIVLLIIALVARSQTKADKFRRARVIAVLPIGFFILNGAANLEPDKPDKPDIRTQVEIGFSLSGGAKTAVSWFIMETGRMPENNAEAGVSDIARIYGEYITSVEVKNGTVVVTYGNEADPAIQGRKLDLVPTANPRSVEWECSSRDIEPEHLPRACR